MNMDGRLKSQFIPDYAEHTADSYFINVLGLTSLAIGMAQLFVLQCSTTISHIYLSFMQRGGATRAEVAAIVLLLPTMAALFGGLGVYLTFNEKDERTPGAGLCWAGFLLGTAWLLMLALRMVAVHI